MSSSKIRDWRIPDQNSPLQNLLKKSPLSSTSPNSNGRKTSFNLNKTSFDDFISNDINTWKKKNEVKKLKSVAEPASISSFFILLAIHVCKKILFININYKVLFFILCSVVVSLITDHMPPPSSPFSSSNSFLNTIFIKYSWTWACALNALFIFFTCSVFQATDFFKINRNLMRLLLATLWYILCLKIFDLVASKYGICIKNSQSELPTDRNNCSGKWLAFSISDRLFALLHCSLVTQEEGRAWFVWERLQNVLIKNKGEGLEIKLKENKIEETKDLYKRNTSSVQFLLILLSLTLLLLDLQICVSIIYFNNMPQKTIAVLFSSLGWILSYRTWFKSKPYFVSYLWTPGHPGNNIFILCKDF